MLVLMFSIVGAETFKEKSAAEFTKTCTDSDGERCSNSALCNITIKYPNSTEMISNVNMTNNNNGIFNVTLTSNNLSALGTHSWDMFCCDGGSCDEAHGTFVVTKTGVELTQDKALIYLGLLVILIFLFIIILGAIYYLPTGDVREEGTGILLSINKLKYLKSVFIVMAYSMLLAIMFTSSNIAYLYLETKMMGNLLFAMFKIMYWMVIPMLFIWFVWIFVSIFNDKEVKRMLDRGIEMGVEP